MTKKKLLGVLIITVSVLCGRVVLVHAATYYVSSSDAAASDTNTSTQAQSQSTPWKSIERVNTALAAANPGDTFLFKRGDTFFGGLSVAGSGTANTPITFSAYGNGAKPIISGFATIASGWTNSGGNIWEIDAPSNVDATSTMVINGAVAPLARWPKVSAGNDGYLMSDTGTTISITDAELLGAPPFTAAEGTEIVVRPNHWALARAPLGSIAGTTITFPLISTRYPVGANMGYFLQNSEAFLTETGDWTYNPTTHKLKLYYVGTPPTVSFSQVDQLVSLNTADYLTFSNLSFQGAKIYGMYGNTSSGITVDADEFIYAGQYAIRFGSGGAITITNSLIADSQNNAVLVYSPSQTGITIKGNTISNTGIRPGAVAPFLTGDLLHAINVSAAGNATIEANTIENTGYVGIRFQGSGISVTKNIVKNYTLVLDDGAGIYTYNGGSGNTSQWSGRSITNNIISKGIGARAGTLSGATQSNGIYLDLNSNNITIANNTIFDIANKAISVNSPQNVTVTGNTAYNTKVAVGINRINDGVTGGQEMGPFTMSNNIFFQTVNDQLAIQYQDYDINFPSTATVDARIGAIGTSNNKYRLLNPAAFAVSYRTAPLGDFVQNPSRSFAQWKALSSFDAASTEISVPTYKINSLTGANLLTISGTFDAGITGVAGFGPLCTYTADTTSKLTSTGSLKVTVVTPTTSATAHCESSGRIGAVTSGKKYVLRFSTIGTTDDGSFQVTLMHKSSAPIVLSPWQKGSFGTSRTEHEFLFTSPITDSAPSWIIDMYAQSGGTLYIDNVEVYEVDATLLSDNESSVFVYNDTPNQKTVTLSGAYADVRTGTVYTNSMSLPAYSSTVLLKSSGTTTPPPVTDTTPPTVFLTSPVTGTTVSGTAVTLTATASDNIGVTVVDFYYGTTLIGTDATAPYSTTWTTTGIANGSYVLKAVARDAAGNSTTSTTVTVIVSNLVTDTTAPTVSLATPATTTVSGTITLSATASDNIGVTRVEFYKDSDTSPFITDTTSPYTASFNTTTVANGAHTFKATAYDAAGNRRTSATLTLTTANTTTTPPPVLGGGGGGGGTSEPVVTPAAPIPATPTDPLAPVVPTVPTSPGCANGNLFSSLNGARCDGASASSVQSSTTATVTGRVVNVRLSPVSGAVVATVRAGAKGTVLTSSAGWVKIAFATATGWVSQSLVSLSAISVSIPTTSTSTGSYNFGPVTLTTGSRGEGVKELQRFLNRYLNLGLVIDGILGPKTTAVIRTWQSQHNLVPDGLIGAKTKAMMNSIAAQ